MKKPVTELRSAAVHASPIGMMHYLSSLAVGLLVGVIYALLGVRSPAPPLIALLGLLGMLVGEQVVPTVRRVVSGRPPTVSWFLSECAPKITGAPPADPPRK